MDRETLELSLLKTIDTKAGLKNPILLTDFSNESHFKAWDILTDAQKEAALKGKMIALFPLGYFKTVQDVENFKQAQKEKQGEDFYTDIPQWVKNLKPQTHG